MNSDHPQFARLLEAVGTGPRSWTEAELEPMWQHFCHSILSDEFDLELGEDDSPIATWNQMIESTNPSGNTLRAIKNAAKRATSSELTNLPPPIARMVYHASLALAKIRGLPTMSNLSSADLRTGWQWASQQKWIDNETRTILLAALAPTQSDSPQTESIS